MAVHIPLKSRHRRRLDRASGYAEGVGWQDLVRSVPAMSLSMARDICDHNDNHDILI